MKFIETEQNYSYWIGESAKENWELLDKAKGTDYFFHLSSFSSGYVILTCDELTTAITIEAARACKAGTKHKNLNNVKVDYCLVSNLQKGESVGCVIFKKRRQVRQVGV